MSALQICLVQHEKDGCFINNNSCSLTNGVINHHVIS